jgi:uncharacterized protein YbaP (TraB family)
MKKRLLSLLLVLMLCISMLPVNQVLAATNSSLAVEELQSFAAGQTYSDWAVADLVVADTYGLYPVTWYEKDMTKAITPAKMRVLMAGLRYKMLDTDSVQTSGYTFYNMPEKMTVEEVMNYLFETVVSFTFTKDLALKGTKAVTYMKENGIYTGKNGELGLKKTCSVEQACVIAARLVTNIYDRLDAASKGFLWETKANGNTVYMLGSIHMATNKIYPFSNKILAAYQNSDALGLEVNLYDQAGAMDLVNMAVYTDGTTLKDHVSKETYDRVIAFVKTYGYSEEQIAMLKPWYIYISFSALSMTNTGSVSEATAGASLGIDMNFLNNAMLYGKPVLELEGYKSQASMLDSFSDELEEYLLNSTIDAVTQVVEGTSKSSASDLNLMLELWRKGDAEKFKEYTTFEYEYQDMLENGSTETEKKLIAEFHDKLFIQRNKTMADYIEGLLKAEGSKTYFVIVGSGHYLGNDSVLDILEGKGYTITQIK